jgi:hypothetical protein
MSKYVRRVAEREDSTAKHLGRVGTDNDGSIVVQCASLRKLPKE